MIKAVIFDCFGVLTTDTWKEFVATLPVEQADKARMLNRSYDAGQLTKADFLQSVEQLTGKQPTQVEDMLDNEITKNTSLLDYIAKLKKHYKIGLLSNVATDWITGKFLTGKEKNLFDATAFSYEVKASKPDLMMYEAITDRLGVESEECVFIDDSEGHCTAAKTISMKAICYKDFEQMKRELEQILSA